MQLSRIRGFFSDQFRPESARAGLSPAQPFRFAPDDEPPLGPEAAIEPLSVTRSAAPVEEAATADEFRFEARASDFEVNRAMTAYIPLLEACYALANQQPVALPAGYESLGEIRADMAERAVPMESAEAREAVRADFAAAEASIADPTAFGFVIREQATGATIVCIRGTQTPREWLANFTAVPNPFTLVQGFGAVHLGFDHMYRSVRDSIDRHLATLPPASRITVLGHSLGGAMAILAAVDLRRNFGRTHLDVCTFGGPRVGLAGFRRHFNAEITACFRVTNQFDVVPHVPSVVAGWNHVGEEIEVDGEVDNPHSLKAYLEGLRRIGTRRELAAAPQVAGVVPSGGAVSIRVP
jgi:hypothetical protein